MYSNHYQQPRQQQPPPPPLPPSSKQQPNLPSQQHQQWSNRYQPAPSSWSGHNYHHAQGSSGPSAYHPPPQSYHYHQHNHHQSSRIHACGPHPHHYQTSSPAGPGSNAQPMQHMQMRAPLVSPSTPAVTSATSTPMTSSSHHLNLPPPLPASAKASDKEIDVVVNATVASMSTEGMMTTKPPRPYTEYTMFYQLEREFIIHRILATDDERNGTANKGNTDNHCSPGSVDSNCNQVALFENDPLMPARYRSLPLRADWYISGKTKKPSKRKHRKSHGKIGFLELTRMIAARWAKVDDETKKYCKMMAAMELVKYKEDMECYNQYKDCLSAMGEIPEDMKERLIKKQKQQERKEAERFKEAIAASASPPTLLIKADAVCSSTAMSITRNVPIKLEPFDHGSPIERITDMDEFISSLIDSPNRPSSAKIITPERRSNRIHNGNPFRGRPALVSSSAAVTETPTTLSKTFDEFLSPLGNGDVNLDGIKMTFSGFDETEMVREFSDQIHSTFKTKTPKGTMRKMAATTTPSSPDGKKLYPSFDYWDHLVGATSP